MFAGSVSRAATPKSVSRASSLRGSQRMLAGLTSRWTIPLGVHLQQSLAHVGHVAGGALPVERPLAFHQVTQRSSRNVLHHQVMLIADGQPGVHADDVGMLDLGHQVGVLAEGFERLAHARREPRPP